MAGPDGVPGREPRPELPPAGVQGPGDVQPGAPQAPAPEHVGWIGRMWSAVTGKPRQAAAAAAAHRVSEAPLPRTQSAKFHRKDLEGRGVIRRHSMHHMDVQIDIHHGRVKLAINRPPDHPEPEEVVQKVPVRPRLEAFFEKSKKVESFIDQLRSGPQALKILEDWGEERRRTENSSFLVKVLRLIDLEKEEGAPNDIKEEIAGKLQKLDPATLRGIYEKHIQKSEDPNAWMNFEGSSEINIGHKIYQAITTAYDTASQKELAEGIAAAFYEIASLTLLNMKTDKKSSDA